MEESVRLGMLSQSVADQAMPMWGVDKPTGIGHENER